MREIVRQVALKIPVEWRQEAQCRQAGVAFKRGDYWYSLNLLREASRKHPRVPVLQEHLDVAEQRAQEAAAQLRSQIIHAYTLLPQPPHEESPHATADKFQEGLPGIRPAFHTLQWLAAINPASPELEKWLQEMEPIIETSSLVAKTRISPAWDEHPRNWKRPNLPALPLLSEEERRIARACLQVVAEEDLFSDGVIVHHTGATREKIRYLLKAWPDIDDSKPAAAKLVNNAMCMLLFFGGDDVCLKEPVSASPPVIRDVLLHYQQIKQWEDVLSQSSPFFYWV